VIAWGYYGILGRVILPALTRSLDGPARATALAAVERVAAPLVFLSIVLFAASGSFLLVIDPRYAGLGDFFASTWTTLMLVKHLLVVAFVVLAMTVDRLIRRLAREGSADAQRSVLRRIRLSAEGATGLGALIVLLTAIAQVAG
jgi:uncharacterized membrane protein